MAAGLRPAIDTAEATAKVWAVVADRPVVGWPSAEVGWPSAAALAVGRSTTWAPVAAAAADGGEAGKAIAALTGAGLVAATGLSEAF